MAYSETQRRAVERSVQEQTARNKRRREEAEGTPPEEGEE